MRDTFTTFENLKAAFRLANDGDAWGTSMGALFSVCFELHHRGDDIPDAWEFKPSPLSGDLRDDSFWTPELENRGTPALLEFGELLHRYTGMLRAAGRDY